MSELIFVRNHDRLTAIGVPKRVTRGPRVQLSAEFQPFATARRTRHDAARSVWQFGVHRPAWQSVECNRLLHRDLGTSGASTIASAREELRPFLLRRSHASSYFPCHRRSRSWRLPAGLRLAPTPAERASTWKRTKSARIRKRSSAPEQRSSTSRRAICSRRRTIDSAEPVERESGSRSTTNQ